MIESKYPSTRGWHIHEEILLSNENSQNADVHEMDDAQIDTLQ